MTSTLKTKIHYYRFDFSKDGQRTAYTNLRENVLTKIGFPAWKNDHSDSQKHFPRSFDKALNKTFEFMREIAAFAGETGNAIELETDHLFNNQWNSAPVNGSDKGMRLFNWNENLYPNSNIVDGYYLEQTPEMKAVLLNTHKCGYCGKQELAAKGYTFCPHCIDSQYLTENDLHLTRMVSVALDSHKRAALTKAERDYLLPVWRDAQIHGQTKRGIERINKMRKDIDNEYRASIANATEKRDAAIWLMDNLSGMVDNWIFYSHTGKHSFGWRKPITDQTVYDQLVKELAGFPFAYEIERTGK